MGGRGAKSGLSQIRGIENNICKDETETAYLLDDSGNVIFSKTDNKSNCVEFTPEQVLAMEGQVLTHNHPGGTTFSYEDINLLVEHKLKEIRAATKTGTFSLSLKEKNSLSERHKFHLDYGEAVKQCRSITDKEYEKSLSDYSDGKITERQFQEECDKLNNKINNFRHEWLEDHSSNYGYTYKFFRR